MNISGKRKDLLDDIRFLQTLIKEYVCLSYDKDQSKHSKADNCRVETEIRYSHLGDDREYGREYKNRQRVASQIMQKSSYATADIIVYK